MELNIDTCPLVSYVEQYLTEKLDVSLIRQMHRAALSGDLDDVYSYGLLISHFLGGEYFADPEDIYDIPDDTWDALWKRAYEVFAYAAQRGYAEAMVAVSECLFEGAGTEKDMHAGQLWLEAAKKNGVPLDDPRIVILSKRYGGQSFPAPVLN